MCNRDELFCYRASWIRDSSFTLYALLRLGFTKEADGQSNLHHDGIECKQSANAAYMEFIFERLRNKNPDGSLQIMYTIHGSSFSAMLLRWDFDAYHA
jgi:GH15 family glucan-1,4-alpha-glucosidase